MNVETKEKMIYSPPTVHRTQVLVEGSFAVLSAAGTVNVQKWENDPEPLTGSNADIVLPF
jgi:hypothetical protein